MTRFRALPVVVALTAAVLAGVTPPSAARRAPPTPPPPPKPREPDAAPELEPTFKPSDVVLVTPPLVDTFGRAARMARGARHETALPRHHEGRRAVASADAELRAQAGAVRAAQDIGEGRSAVTDIFPLIKGPLWLQLVAGFAAGAWASVMTTLVQIAWRAWKRRRTGS